MGRDSADALMGLLPPVGWADVATKQDLTALGDRVLADPRKELNGVVLKMFALVVALVPTLVIPLVTLT